MQLRKSLCAISVVVVLLIVNIVVGLSACAEGIYDIHIGVSPMNESIIVNPGDTYRGSFTVNNPGYSEKEVTYRTDIGPFYVDENYNPIYVDVDGGSEIVKWTKVVSGATGTLKPNDVASVEFEISVPETAPAGGQYEAISVTVELSSGEGNEGINIGESMAISHVILAEVTGRSVSAGKILDTGIQGFMLGGNVTAYSMVENTGNVHGQAIYNMKVYPLFSDQPIYDNTETKEKQYVLPGRKFQDITVWEETPMVGIFNVQYTVDFMGSKSEVTRTVVVCPWWLLLLIVMGLVLMILRIITLIKMRNNRKRDAMA